MQAYVVAVDDANTMHLFRLQDWAGGPSCACGFGPEHGTGHPGLGSLLG